MNLFPFKKREEEGRAERPLFMEFAWDFEKDCHIVENGELKKVTGNEALKVWVYKTLKISRYRYLSFSWQYGSELDALIGQALPLKEQAKKIQTSIEDELRINPYIKGVKHFELTVDEGERVASFILETIYGEVAMRV